MRYITGLFTILSLAACSKKEMPLKSGIDTTAATVTYAASNDDIVNPERGFYQYAEIHAGNYIPLDQSLLTGYRSSQSIDGATYTVASSLVYTEYVLDGLTNSTIPASFLTNFDKDCATARAAGVKLIPRFIYTNTTHSGSCAEQSVCPVYGDAPKAIILQHIAQLKPYFQKDEDVIACFQLGFIGIYGENYYTDYFGDASGNGQGKLLDANWTDRIEVLKAMLDATPADRMVQVRIPQLIERYFYGVNANVISAALTDAQAFTETNMARIGFHNDCFLASTDDYGTYFDYGNSSSGATDAITPLRNFEMANSKYTVVGGETCDDSYSPQNDCGPAGMAQQEFAGFHYSFLNAVYNLDVNNDWVTGGCMADIKNKLGYRFVLHSAALPAAASRSGSITVSFNIENQGYASPYNPRPLQLILRNKSTGKVTALTMTDDVRKWYTGSYTIKESLALPAGIDAGAYDLLLNLPDAAASIATRPEYSIQLANVNTWEATTGYNKLNASVNLQ